MNLKSDDKIMQMFNKCKTYQILLQYYHPIPSLPKELDKQMLLIQSPILDFLNNNVDEILNFNLLIKASKHNIKILEWLIKKYTEEISIEYTDLIEYYKSNTDIIPIFLENDMILSIKLLLNTNNIPLNGITHIFINSCKFGYLEIARWLKRNWPDIDHRSLNDYAFRYACENGHLYVA